MKPAWLQTPVTLKGEAIPFLKGISLLSTQLKRGILLDGEPNLKAYDWDKTATGQEMLDAYCDQYDYIWTLGKQGVILLRKRFRDPDELPQMHRAEMTQMTRDVIQALTALPYDTNRRHGTDMFRALYFSLTPDELAILRSGRSIPYADLSPIQQTSVEQIYCTQMKNSPCGILST